MPSENEENIGLTGEEISKETSKRLEKYNGLNFFEEFSMFMGTAQILEFGLKKLLEEKFEYSLENIEKWTLGRVKNELKKNELREDFIILLESVVDYRNYIAHELLVNVGLMKALFKEILPDDNYSKDHRLLHKAINELEQLVFLFDWTQENNAWD
jgi:hypothetical protein